MGIYDNPAGFSGGLLGNAYIDPMTAGSSAAAQALLPMMGMTRTPTGGLGAALAAAGSGFNAGAQGARQQNLQMTPMIIQQIRLNAIAQRHPDWFGQQQPPAGDPSALDTQAASPPPPGPSLLQQSQDLTGQTGFSPGGILAQQAPPGALPGQQIAAGPGAPAPLPTQAQPANAFARPGQPGGTGLPTTAQDAEDYLFLHPEMKEIVAKNFAGPTDAERALLAAGINPTSPQGKAMLSSAALNSVGFKPFIGGERAGIPLQYFNPNTMHFEADTSQLPALEAAAAASSRGTATGALGAKDAEAAYKAGLDVKVANETAKRKTFYETGVMPPDYGGPQTSPTTVSPGGDIATSRGTVVSPPPPPPPFMGSDAILKQNANTQETEKNFGFVRPGLDGAESRLVATAQALKTVEGKGFNEHRAAIAAKLDGLGFKDAANLVMGGKEVAAVQSALALQTIDILGQLKQINQGSGGKTMNSEFVNMLDKQYGPDLKPEANFGLITQALGGIYQTRNMIDDYDQVGKPAGWGRDANAFVSTWQSNKANSYPEMVKRAEKAIGPLAGMTGNAPAGIAPPSSAVQHLQMNPSLASDFDKKYGAGAAAKVLGK